MAAGLLLFACKSADLPSAYNFTVRETKNNPYGCWMTATYRSGDGNNVVNSVAGELICMESDTAYILVADSIVRPVPIRSVSQARLFTHKNQAGTYLLVTFLFLLPNIIGLTTDYPAEFAAYGIPTAVTGITTAIIEGTNEWNILKYPESVQLLGFKNLARYPAGKPGNVDFHSLTLKKGRTK